MIDAAEDRERFQKLLTELGLRQPPNATARTEPEALQKAEALGYPLVVRPSYVLGGRAMEIVHEQRELERYMREAVKVSNDSPVLLDRFLNDATEVDVDAVSDGNDVVIAEKTADASASQVVAAQQSIESARQALNAVRDMEGYLRLTAPFAGVVTERNVHPGALVGPASGAGASTPLLRIVDTLRLRLVVPVPEAYTAEMKPGTEIAFAVAAYPGQSFSGKVARIAESIDVGTRSMAVELDVINSDGRLAPGTFCQVRWPVRRAGASLFVPSASVATTTDRTFVIRIRAGKTEWVDVRTGLTSGALVEVFGDLRAGDEIAGRGTDELRPGTDVRPRETKPAA
jgi:RND family efflux transporter MFP subunit